MNENIVRKMNRDALVLDYSTFDLYLEIANVATKAIQGYGL